MSAIKVETMSSLLENPQQVVVTCPSALLRFLPSSENFKDCIINIKVGEEMDMDQLKMKLIHGGYSQTSHVDQPLSFAARGGIVDVYSINYDHPIRIEFFDTVIESIRLFHEETQRTIETVDSVLINPATDLLFTDDQIEYLQKEIDSELEKQHEKLIQDDYDFLLDYI